MCLIFRLKGLYDGDSAVPCILGTVFLPAASLSLLVVSASSFFLLAFGHHSWLSSLPHNVSSLALITN